MNTTHSGADQAPAQSLVACSPWRAMASAPKGTSEIIDIWEGATGRRRPDCFWDHHFRTWSFIDETSGKRAARPVNRPLAWMPRPAAFDGTLAES